MAAKKSEAAVASSPHALRADQKIRVESMQIAVQLGKEHGGNSDTLLRLAAKFENYIRGNAEEE